MEKIRYRANTGSPLQATIHTIASSMKCDPSQNHHRRSIRLSRYDYSRSGAYFITICTHNRFSLFGQITDAEMHLNNAGRMIYRWYDELENKFPDIQCDAFVCMPNHVHFIVINVGADLRVCPDFGLTPNQHNDDPASGENAGMGYNVGSVEHTAEGEHTGSPLQRILQWFKTMTTNDYIHGVKQHGWPLFSGKLWQRNYWEHIIRNEPELNRIREYIRDNPANWVSDSLYVES